MTYEPQNSPAPLPSARPGSTKRWLGRLSLRQPTPDSNPHSGYGRSTPAITLTTVPCTSKSNAQFSHSPSVAMALNSNRSLPTTLPCIAHAIGFLPLARARASDSGIAASASVSSKIGSQPFDPGAAQSKWIDPLHGSSPSIRVLLNGDGVAEAILKVVAPPLAHTPEHAVTKQPQCPTGRQRNGIRAVATRPAAGSLLKHLVPGIRFSYRSLATRQKGRESRNRGEASVASKVHGSTSSATSMPGLLGPLNQWCWNGRRDAQPR